MVVVGGGGGGWWVVVGVQGKNRNKLRACQYRVLFHPQSDILEKFFEKSDIHLRSKYGDFQSIC